MNFIPRSFCLLAISVLAASCGREDEAFIEIEREERFINTAWQTEDGFFGAEEVGDGLIRAQYLIPPSVFARAEGLKADPFTSPRTEPKPAKRSVREIFEQFGIRFSEGTSAEYYERTGLLTVVQTREQMELVEAWLDTGGKMEKAIQVGFELYRAPLLAGLEIIESIRSQAEHTPERNALLKAAREGKVRCLAAPNLLCRGGQRAKISEAPRSRNEDRDSDGKENAGLASDPIEQEPFLEFEFDPILSEDEYWIDVNFSLSYRTEDRPDLVRSITTQTLLPDRGWQMVGNWSVANDEMILVFLTANVQTFAGAGPLIEPSTAEAEPEKD